MRLTKFAQSAVILESGGTKLALTPGARGLASLALDPSNYELWLRSLPEFKRLEMGGAALVGLQ